MIFKAVLASQKLKIPRTHDLVFLSSLVFSNKKIDSNLLKTLKQLNAFAVDIRYPNDFIISLEETKLYLKEAEKIVKLVKENILGLGI